jgi:tripartite-type tricarboxylate transporter receptor subunit TctC
MINATASKQIISLSVLFMGVFFLVSSFLKQNNKVDSYQNAAGETVQKIGPDYFKDKTIEWVIPFKEGGGADTWARFNAPYFMKHIPGNPVVIINNIPGGGSIKGANLFAKRVQPDGIMILGTSGTTQMPYLLDDPRVRYDYSKYKPIMAYPTGGVVYCSPSLGIKSAEEMEKIKDIPLKYASQGPTSLDLIPMFSFDLAGLKVEAVFGFRGRGAGRLAFERGEVLIDYQTSSAYIKNVLPLVASGEAIPLFSFGALDENGRLIRDPSFPDLPHFGEVYQQLGYECKGIAWDTWFAFMSAGFGGMKLLLTPKETPQDIVDLYVQGIVDMKTDPAYQKSKIIALGYYEQVTGKAADKIFDLATNVDSKEKEYMKNWLREKYGLNI